MPSLLLACLAYLDVALPGSTLGLLWPAMRLSFHEPVGALGILLAFGVTASVISSAGTGRLLSRVGVRPVLALGIMLSALALAQEALAALAFVFTVNRRAWEPRLPDPPLPGPGEGSPAPPAGARRRGPRAVALGALTFAAIETGIESGAGIWGYVFLTAGRGLPHEAAGVAVSAYWAMMFAGRAVLGPVAERVGPHRVLAGAVAGVALGAALMTVPTPGFVAVIGMMILGLAAAPVFPLLTLTTAHRAGVTGTTRAVGLQVAASAVGGAALPAGLGMAIGAFDAGVLAPALLVLGLAMCGVYGFLSRLTGRAST